MNTTQFNKSVFSIENILQCKTPTKATSGHSIPAITVKSLSKVDPDIVDKATWTCKMEKQAAVKNINLVKTATDVTFSPSAIHLQSHQLPLGHTMAVAATPALHFDPVHDPFTSLFYHQVMDLQKSSAFLMSHMQPATAAAHSATSVYGEPYNHFIDYEGFTSNGPAAVAGVYCNATYPGFYMPGFAVKRKGGQVRFTSQQTKNLENRFNFSRYLSPEERRQFAAQLKLTDRQVKTWFQNRRAKWRRASLAKHSHATQSFIKNTNENLKGISEDFMTNQMLSSINQQLTSDEQKFLSDNGESESDSGSGSEDENIYVEDIPNSA